MTRRIPGWIAREEQHKTGTFVGKLSLLRQDGTPFPAEVSIAAYRDGGGGRTGIIVWDITERKPTEGSRRQRDLYETLLEAQSDVGEGFLVVENERIRYANEAFCLISGYSAAELTVLPTFLELVVPDQRSLMEDRMRRQLRGEAVEACYEVAILHRSGRRVELDVAVRPLPRENQPSRLVAVVRDTTERRRLEERLQSSLSALVAVHEAGRVLSSTLEQKEIGARLLSIMRRICDLSAAVIDLRDGDRRWVVLAAVGPESLWKGASATVEVRVARLRALESKKHQPFGADNRKKVAHLWRGCACRWLSGARSPACWKSTDPRF